jgi:hypothetical protein
MRLIRASFDPLSTVAGLLKSGATSIFVFELCLNGPVIVTVGNNFGNLPPKITEVRALVTLSPSVDQGPPYLSFQPVRQTFFKFLNTQLFSC